MPIHKMKCVVCSNEINVRFDIKRIPEMHEHIILRNHCTGCGYSFWKRAGLEVTANMNKHWEIQCRGDKE